MKPKIILCLALVLSGSLVGCSTAVSKVSLNAPNLPSGLPVLYHNSQYDFTFSLPASWRGHSVLIQQWEGETYSPTTDKTAETEHGPVIVLRHPQWKTNNLYQDIPIMVFTSKQWDEEQQGRFFPYAGGVIGEMWRNCKYVFGLYSRYNACNNVKGWKEADDIIATNCAAHAGSTLYVPTAGQIDGGLSIKPSPTNSFGFPLLPPIADANPSIRLPLLVHVPTKLWIQRTTDTLSVEIDRSSLEATNPMVGTNMVTGVESEFYVYPEGEPRPANGGYGLGGTDFNLGRSFWHTKPDGIPLPGRKYVVELDLTIFETDIPSQHMWRPQSSKNYKVLWQRTLKQTVLNTPTFLQNILRKIEQQVPELGSIGMTTGTPSSGQVWHGEEFGERWICSDEKSKIPPCWRISPGNGSSALWGYLCHNHPVCFLQRRSKRSQ